MVLKIIPGMHISTSAIAMLFSVLIPKGAKLLGISAQNAITPDTHIQFGLVEAAAQEPYSAAHLLADGYADGVAFVCWQAEQPMICDEFRKVIIGFFLPAVNDILYTSVMIDE